MAYEEEQREVTAHLDQQARVLRRYQYASLAVAALASIGLLLGLGTPAMFVFAIAFVYWRDTRNRQQSLENARASFQSFVTLAQGIKDLTDRIDAVAPRGPQPTPLQSFMQRVNRSGNTASA